jgi:hypothetical protein
VALGVERSVVVDIVVVVETSGPLGMALVGLVAGFGLDSRSSEALMAPVFC